MPVTYSELDVKLPIVMLPVRIETRYFDVNPDNVELRIRIFPSPAHVTSSRPGIDPPEREETIAFWRTRKATGDTSAATDAAWQRLSQTFGDARAQYLRRILTPTTDASGNLVFPNVTMNPPPETSDVLVGEAIALPSRFFVVGFQGSVKQFTVNGAKVPNSVVVGPHGDANAIRWQSDFGVAESIGLALRVPLTRPNAQALTRLFVYGVREGADAAGSQAALESLLERHSREEGIALLPAGTPTNNTPIARVPTPAPATGVTPGATSNGGRIASAFGIPAAAFAGAAGITTSTHDALVEAMHTALWPATLGYFCDAMMFPSINEAAAARGRTLFQKFVRPRGPYSTLALGGQPYGVLPVAALSRWTDSNGVSENFARALETMRSQRVEATTSVPRLGQSADAGADLSAVLSLSPISTRWTARTLKSNSVMVCAIFGPALGLFPGIDAKFWKVTDESKQWRGAVELAPVGIGPVHPTLSFHIFDDPGFKINLDLVAAPGVSKTAALAANYIDAIANAEVEPLKTHNVTGSTPRTLLYLLLRHATLLAMVRTAIRFQTTEPGRFLDSVFINEGDTTVWTRLNTPVEALQNKTVAEVLKGPLPTNPEMAEFTQQRNALKTLSRQPVGELERLTSEAVDAASHRLDAWITGLVSERLAKMRVVKPLGSHVGAYAWVDAPPLPAVLPKDGVAPVLDPDSEGYIHAPQLDHARTAAILRAGFIARHQENAQAALTIDLSSDRVRDARGLLEGVRNGASLAALLGERIERWMVELGSATELPNVRGQFSLIDGSGRKRIDGLKAAQAWGQSPPPNLQAVASRLASAIDAMGDLLLAEAVHQQAAGNPGRAQPALAALDTGVALPSEFEVTRTAADSTASTWRVVLPLAPDAVNAWIAEIVGNPATLSATITKPGQAPITKTLSQIGVTATGLMDYVKAGAEASALSILFSEKSGGGAVSFSAELQTALNAAFAITRLLRGSRKLQEGDLGPTRVPIAAFDKNSARKEWLHDLSRVRPSIEALDGLDFILRSKAKDLKLRFLTADRNLNVVSIGDLPAGAPVGLLIDGWNEATPGTQATTGIAMHYDAPRSRAPQAVLVMVPPDPRGWSIESVEATLVETAELAQVRLLRPVEMHGSYLPALYFADNTAGDTVATDFLGVGTVPQVTVT